MIYLRNRLADFEINVAHYYEERGAWVAAAQRARQTIEQYDGAPAVKEALRDAGALLPQSSTTRNSRRTPTRCSARTIPDESGSISSTHGRPWWKFWG